MSRTFDELTEAQDRTLGLIATYGRGPYHPKVIAALLAKGLIEMHSVVVAHDRFGPIEIVAYKMPLAEHIRWCAWCAENVSIPERGGTL